MNIDLEYDTLLQGDVEAFFRMEKYEFVNDIVTSLDYLINHGYLREYEDVVDGFIEAFNIQCPMRYINTDLIVADDEDYEEVGNDFTPMYLNVYMLYECDGFDDLKNNNIIKVIE